MHVYRMVLATKEAAPAATPSMARPSSP